jgi:hypothetical protein
MKIIILLTKAFLVFTPFVWSFAAAPLNEVYQKCLQNSREVHQTRLQDCRGRSRIAVRCRAEAEKEKRELLDYCAAGIKQQPATIVVTSH